MMYAAAYAYFALLCALVLVIWRRGQGPMLRTIVAIALNSLIANAYTMASADTDPWWFFMFLDVLTARMIGWTYVAQIAMHSAYGLALYYGQPEPIKYWWMLTFVGYVQLLLVGGWWLSGRRFDLRRFRWLRRLAPAAHQKGVGG
jgi:hypothetical protein